MLAAKEVAPGLRAAPFAVTGRNTRIQGHVAAAGRRSQAKRDAR